MKKFYFTIAALLAIGVANAQTVVYSNNFESGAGTATIVGAGTIVTDATAGFNKVFQNATGGMRANYLTLPQDALSHSTTTNEMSISVWVNAKNAGASTVYMWSPMFTAYAVAPVANSNGMPMFALQYRGVGQLNNNGWCDFVDANNDKGVNTLYHNTTDWLVDGKWHLYTATLTKTSLKVYFDGVIANSWTEDGVTQAVGNGQVIAGLFSNGADLKYICLGGNQAWNWGDPDPGFMFDDIAIYDMALNPNQIAEIIAAKPLITGLSKQSTIDGKVIGQEFYSISGAKAGSDFSTLKKGVYIMKSVYSNGAVKSAKIVKAE